MELATSPEVQGSDLVKELCSSTIAMYTQASPPLPWVQGVIVGTCAYKSPPVSGEVEIAYFTFPVHETRGVGTKMAQDLIDLAKELGVVKIRAQTLPEENASTRILEKLGFEFSGSVIHPEDGEVWEWRKSGTA